MSNITKPIILNETGQDIVEKLSEIAEALGMSLVPNKALVSDNTGKMVASNITNTELNYLSGVTSNIQSQINSKEDGSNKVTSINSSSSDEEYPSAKCVYDIVGNIETLLGGI